MKLLLAFLFLLPITDLLLGLARWNELTHCWPGTTPSALTHAFSELRTGSTPSCLHSASLAGLEAEKVELFFQPGPAMLLYWNGIQENWGPFPGKRVLIGQGYPASVFAYDIDEKNILWRHNFVAAKEPGKQQMPINSSAPVISREHQRIYGTYIEEEFIGKRATDSRLTQHYYSIGLDGTGAEEIKVDLAPFLLEKGTKATADDIRKYLRCRTALGFNRDADPPYVISGCSIVRAFSFEGANFVHEASSQNTKGIRGVLLALPIRKADGRFGPTAEIRKFLPSRIGPAPDAGVDGGIWLSGGAPTLLPGNKWLVAIGNGAFRPEEGLYGCALLRLNGQSLAVEGSYFNARGKSAEEASRACHEGNLDLSSSAAATIREGEKLFSAIGGKDGWLKVLDPLTLQGQEVQVSDSYLFGQPILWPGTIVALGGNTSKGSSWSAYHIEDGFRLKKLWEVNSAFARAYNSSATGTNYGQKESPLLFVPLRAGSEGEVFRSALQVVDVENGKVLLEAPFEGITHFSMPTPVDDQLFVPTAEHGIYRFKAKTFGWREFLRRQTILGKLL